MLLLPLPGVLAADAVACLAVKKFADSRGGRKDLPTDILVDYFIHDDETV